MSKLNIDYDHFESKFELDARYDEYFDEDGMLIKPIELSKQEN